MGQKVVQLPPSRKGAPEVAGQEVHDSESIGELQVLHALLQGLQKPVAFAAKPAGQAARHLPRCISGALLLESHERQLASSGPSQLAQELSQEPQELLLVT